MAAKRTVHKSLTESRVLAAAESEMFGTENPGFCLDCGAEQDGCEPDARHYVCEECGKRSVFGAAEMVMSGYYHTDIKGGNDGEDRTAG